jgi:hypothetical protein
MQARTCIEGLLHVGMMLTVLVARVRAAWGLGPACCFQLAGKAGAFPSPCIAEPGPTLQGRQCLAPRVPFRPCEVLRPIWDWVYHE